MALVLAVAPGQDRRPWARWGPDNLVVALMTE